MSTFTTSQIIVAKWHDIIDEPTYADAILDRMVITVRSLVAILRNGWSRSVGIGGRLPPEQVVVIVGMRTRLKVPDERMSSSVGLPPGRTN
jgi:hypothetical protein